MNKYSCFDLKVKDYICDLVLNRPNELNTMTRDFWVELGDALEEINRNSDIRVVVLSSTGKHFFVLAWTLVLSLMVLMIFQMIRNLIMLVLVKFSIEQLKNYKDILVNLRK